MRLASFVAALVLSGAAVSAQWPQWRGPNRDGVASVWPRMGQGWPEKLERTWSQPIGEGYSSPVIDGGRVFVHSREDPDEIVSAFEFESGEQVWTARYPAPFRKNQYAVQMAKGPFSTPLAAGGLVYTMGVTAVLSAFDAGTGTLKWRKDFSKEIDTSKLFTGTAMSPILADGLLIVHAGDDSEGAFRASDPATGAEKWTLPGHGPGYASPVLVSVAGTRQIATMTDKAVVGVDIASGRLLWSIPFPDEWNENIVTPTMAGDVLVVSGTRKGTFGYRIEKNGNEWIARQLWHNAELPMYLSSPVADGPFLYGFSNRRKGQLFCLDARTGIAKWTTEGRAGQKASLASVGTNLLVLTTDGDLLALGRNPERFEEIKRYKVADGGVWAHLAVGPGGFVVRDARSVALWSLK
jgi:outer membrane protein assembly factor BamB